MKFLYDKDEKVSSAFEIRRGIENKETKNEISFNDIASGMSNLNVLGLVEIFREGKIKVYKITKDGEKVFKNKTFLVKNSSKLYRQVFI